MIAQECLIWRTPAEVVTGGGGARVTSARAGGTYRVLDEVGLTDLNLIRRAQLTTWLVDRRRFGEEAPLITHEVLEALQRKRPLPMSQKKERYFRCLARDAIVPSFRYTLDVSNEGLVNRRSRLESWTECVFDEDISELTQLLVAEGYLRWDRAWYMLTSKGFERLEELEAGNPESAQGFIAMWFATEMAEASIAIEGAVSDAGYAPLRIDKKEHNNDISDEIIAEIRRSRFLIADATCGSVTPEGNSHPIGVLRGGVYYEAGFATGLNIPVIWSCREDCIGFVHFDTRQYAHVLWNEPSQLRVALKNRIVAVAGWGPLARPDQAIAPQQV